MKKLMFMAFTLGVSATALSAQAADLMVAAAMQRCTTNEECQLVTNSCADSCAFVPVNKTSLELLAQQYAQRCGKAMDSNPPCNMTPPIAAACINQRCTIDYAFANNSSAKDYQAGAYPTAEKATPDQVKGDYSKVDDKKGGFSAYNLPQNEIKEKTLGNITTKVYVPPSAPVSGDQYVPVNGAPQPQPAPAPAPAAPAPMAAPVMETPPTPAPAPAVMPEPAMVPPPAAMPAPAAPMSGNGYVSPPPMTPSMPNQQMPAAPVAPPVVAPVPAAPVPVAPSDLQPTPTFVPPAGDDVPAVLEHEGTVQPDGTIETPPAPPSGKFDILGEQTKPASKSFNGSSKLPSYN